MRRAPRPPPQINGNSWMEEGGVILFCAPAASEHSTAVSHVFAVLLHLKQSALQCFGGAILKRAWLSSEPAIAPSSHTSLLFWHLCVWQAAFGSVEPKRTLSCKAYQLLL